MSKPTILVDGHVLDGKPQGSSAYLAGLYRAIAQIGGVDIRMATNDVDSLRRWDLELPCIDWIPLKSTNRYKRLAVELSVLQSRLGADFSHFQYIAPLVKRSRWIVTLHDLRLVLLSGDWIGHWGPPWSPLTCGNWPVLQSLVLELQPLSGWPPSLCR